MLRIYVPALFARMNVYVYVYVCIYVHTMYREIVYQNVHCLVLWMYVSKSNIFKLQCI